MTLREKILGTPDIPLHPVVVPEWDATIHVRSLNVRERATLLQTKDKEEDLQLRAVMAGCCNEDGTPLFQPDDRDALLTKNGAVIERLAKQIIQDTFPSVDALEKN